MTEQPINDYLEVKSGKFSIKNLVETIMEVKENIRREQDERSYQRFQETAYRTIVETEKVPGDSFTGQQRRLLDRFKGYIEYPVYIKYLEPYEGCVRQGLFIKLRADFKPTNQRGNNKELAPGIDLYIDRHTISLGILGDTRKSVKYFDEPEGSYLELGDTEEKCLAAAAYLAISSEENSAFYEALIDYISNLLPYDPGEVELAGYDDVVRRCEQVIGHDNPYTMKRNILLVGPPGCGKSMIMKQLARSHPEVVRCNLTRSQGWLTWISLFSKMLQRCDKKVLLFVDEIDELGLTRDRDRASVYELLRLMDGMENTKNLVIVASTNRVEDLDPALLREGRFGPVIHVGYPDTAQKRAILEFYAARYGSRLDADMVLRHVPEDITGAGLRLIVEDCLIRGSEITTEKVIENIPLRNNGIRLGDDVSPSIEAS